MSDTTAADRAYIQHATSAAHAAGRAAALRGITLPRDVAQQIADAVLGHADNKYSVRVSLDRRAWQHPDAHEHALQQLRRQLLDEITSRELLPVALPAQTLTYVSWRYGSNEPLAASTAEPADWDSVEITLTVPVRTP
jgi:hypothetical protein